MKYRRRALHHTPTLAEGLSKIVELSLAEIMALLTLANSFPDFRVELPDGRILVIKDRKITGYEKPKAAAD